FNSERADEPLGERPFTNDLLFSRKVTFEDTKGKPNLSFKIIFCVVKGYDLPHLSGNIDEEPFKEVILLSKKFTLEFALHYIKKYGEDTAESFICHDGNKCLWINILIHFGSFDAIKNESPIEFLSSESRGS
ncbi:MAG: hypothetical protein AAGG81_05795, partial [Chlamydiota bacterium]